MSQEKKKPQKIKIEKRTKVRQPRIRKSKVEDSNENPLLSQAPKSSIAAMMIKKSNERAKLEAEHAERRRNANGISVERDMRYSNQEEKHTQNNNNSRFTRGIIKRFR